MQNEPPEARQSDLIHWAEGAHRNAAALAEMLDVDPDAYLEDPLNLLVALQNYVSRLPLDEFEKSDWITLHTDLTSYLGDVLTHRCGAAWNVVEDSASPQGFRYVMEATGLDGKRRQVEPYAVVMEEFRHLPIEVTRMIANAEVSLGVTQIIADD